MPNTNLNRVSYEEKYAIGYGIQYPDGHIIRVYHQVVKPLLPHGKTLKALDFGTGNGTHLTWLKQQGSWEVYGADVSQAAVNAAQANLPKSAANIKLTGSYPNLEEIFNTKFDLIIANQVLYYVDNKELAHLVDQFHKILNPGGIIIATMMGEENFYYGKSAAVEGSDLRKVTLTGRLNEVTHVNFKTAENIKQDFGQFKKLQQGYYDTVIREDEGRTMHHIFVGQKA